MNPSRTSSSSPRRPSSTAHMHAAAVSGFVSEASAKRVPGPTGSSPRATRTPAYTSSMHPGSIDDAGGGTRHRSGVDPGAHELERRSHRRGNVVDRREKLYQIRVLVWGAWSEQGCRLTRRAGAEQPVQEAADSPAKPRSPLTERTPDDRADMSGIRVAGGLGSTRGTSTDPRPQDDPRAPDTQHHFDSASDAELPPAGFANRLVRSCFVVSNRKDR